MKNIENICNRGNDGETNCLFVWLTWEVRDLALLSRWEAWREPWISGRACDFTEEETESERREIAWPVTGISSNCHFQDTTSSLFILIFSLRRWKLPLKNPTLIFQMERRSLHSEYSLATLNFVLHTSWFGGRCYLYKVLKIYIVIYFTLFPKSKWFTFWMT